MKKLFMITGILVFLVIAAMIIIPVVFKPQLVMLVKKEANNNINATLDFESIGLNLFESFPNVSLNIKHLTVINKAPFEGDTLAYLSTFKSRINLLSLIKDKTVRVVSIVLDEPQIHLTALKDGTTNWNIIKNPEKQKTEPTAQVKNDFKLMLQKYAIKDGTFLYDDRSSGLQIRASHLNHNGSGDFTQDHFQLITQTKIHELSVVSAEINYLTQMKMQLKADIDVNAEDKKLTFKENELQLNQFKLSFDGFVMMPGEETVIDLKFETNENDLNTLLSLFPAVCKKNFADIKTSGQAAVQGYIKGVYNKDHYPAFHLQLSMNDGMFQYSQSSTQVNHITLDFVIDNPGGVPDNTRINLKKCHVEINQEPLDVILQIKKPISDPYFSASAKGNINLLDLMNIMPSGNGLELTGFVSSDLFVEGNLSGIENKQYNSFQAHGHLSCKDINYSGPAMPVKVSVHQADLELKPEKFSLNHFQALLGKSDISASGSLDHVLPWLLKGQTLMGNLTVHSTFFDLNPWREGTGGRQRTAIELPAGLDITVNATVKEVLFGKLKMTDVSGICLLKNKMLHLVDLNMMALDGVLIANGTYSKPKEEPAHAFFDLKMSQCSIGETFQNFMTVQKFVPIAKSIQGNFDANLDFVTDLDPTLTPVFNTFNSSGSLSIQNALIENFKPLDVMADLLKMDKLKILSVKDIEPAYTIRDGRFNLTPLNFMIENTEFMVSGSNSIDMSMNYLMRLKIPSRELNNQTNSVINTVFNKKLDLLQEDHVVLDVSFKGTIDKPDVNISGKEIVRGAARRLIDMAVPEELKQKVTLPDTVKMEIEKQKLQLELFKKRIKKEFKT